MNLASKLPQTVTIATKSGVGDYGDPTFGAQSTVNARVEAQRKIITGTDGEPQESSHVIYSDTLIPRGSRVWLSEDDTGDTDEARRVIDARQIPSLRNAQVLYEARL